MELQISLCNYPAQLSVVKSPRGRGLCVWLGLRKKGNWGDFEEKKGDWGTLRKKGVCGEDFF